MAKITAEDVSKALCQNAIHYRDPDVNEITLPELVKQYLEDLAGMERETFFLAIPEARRACSFFPKSSDILKASKRVVPAYRELPALPAPSLSPDEQAEKNRTWARRIRELCAQKRSPCARVQ
uniref:Uncharacterized protein n=1 Tax=Desulfovibrio sp. U5L TaxID=596152 RepID=I2Q044_9BACT